MSRIPAKGRTAVYIIAVLATAATFVLGIAKPDAVSAAVDSAVRVYDMFAALLAVLNVTPDN